MNLREFIEDVQARFKTSWRKLLDQIPDLDRLDSYRFDEIFRRWTLLNPMPEDEVPILDSNRNLMVETPNFKVFQYENTGETTYTWIDCELNFLADSLSIAFYDASGTKVLLDYVVYYIYGEEAFTGRIEIVNAPWGADTDNVVTQYDLKPHNRFMIDISPDSTHDGVFKVNFTFSKQKKTKISDTAYASSWDAETQIGASKNAIYDKLVLMIAEYVALISDTAYNESTWNAVTTIAPSKNAIRDQIEVMLTAIGLNCTVAEVETIITAELVNGQSIDNAIDSLISDHTGDGDAHHSLNHNDTLNINAGTDYEHITQTQKDALHTIVVAGDLAHNSLASLNDGDNYEHITQTQKDLIHAKLPIGTILMFVGSFTNNVTIVGWYICDGNNGTINLTGKFIRGNTTSGGTGGSDTHQLAESEMPQHAHALGNQSASHHHDATGNKTGNQDTSHDHAIQLHNHSGFSGSNPEGGTHATHSGTHDTGNQKMSHKHSVSLGNQTASHTHTIAEVGGEDAHENMPSYYELIFIQRIS